MEKLDFSALEKLNLPAINISNADLERVVENSPALDKDEVDDIKEEIIKEVDSIESLETEENQNDNQADEDSSEEESSEGLSSDEAAQGEEGEISIIKGVSEWAKAKGIFDYEDSEFEDSEDFLEKKLLEKSKAYSEEWKESLPPVIKDLIDNYEEGVPLDELVYSKSREIEYNQITEEQLEKSEDIQKKLVADWLANQGYEPEEIDSKLKKYEDSLLLEDEAKTAHKKLKAFEAKYQESLKQQTEQKKIQAQEDYNKMLKDIETNIMTADEIIPGIALSKEDKKKIYESYTKTDSSKKTALIKAIESDPNAWFKITQFMVLMGGNLKDVEKKLSTKVASKVKTTVNTYSEKPQTLGKLDINAMKKAMTKIKKSSSK